MRFEWTVALRFLREGGMQTVLIVGGRDGRRGGDRIHHAAARAACRPTSSARTLGAQANIVIVRRRGDRRGRCADEAGGAALPQVQARRSGCAPSTSGRRLARAAAHDPGVVAVAPVASGSAWASRATSNKSVALLGTDPERYLRVVRLDEKIEAGVLRLEPGDALIGIELAKDLGVGVGDRFRGSRAQGPAK